MPYASKIYWVNGIVKHFIPLVAPDSFVDPRKYADYGLKVNLKEKLMSYKQRWQTANIAVEFSDAIVSVQLPSDATIEIFETLISGDEISVLITTGGTHTFTSDSTKRYMIRRLSRIDAFTLPVGSVWAYCYGATNLAGFNFSTGANQYLKYVFLYEYTLAGIGYFRNTAITGTLRLKGGQTNLEFNHFAYCTNLVKVIAGNQLTSINGQGFSGAFQQCTSLQVADLGTGVTSIGTETFNGCTSLREIIIRAHTPPTITSTTFKNVPNTTIWKVPAEDLATYKGWTNYTAFASRIFAI